MENTTFTLSLLVVVLQFSQEEEDAIKIPVMERYELEGHPYFSSARY